MAPLKSNDLSAFPSHYLMVVNIVYIYIYCNIYGIIFSDKFTQEGARELQIGL